MFRLTETERAGAAVVLRVEGRVIGPWVRELRLACEHVLSAGGTLSLDLADLRFIDGDGVELLRHLKDRRVTVANCPLFIAEQLEEPLR